MIVASNASGASHSFGPIPVVVGAPEIPDQSARGKSATSVRLSAQIWTANQATTVHAEYAVDGSDFCANDGLSGAHSTTPISVVPAAATEQTAYATVTGLPTNTDYCVVWLATNASAGPDPFVHGRFHHRRPGRDDARGQRHQLERGDAQRQRQPRGQQHDGSTSSTPSARCSARRTVTRGSRRTSAEICRQVQDRAPSRSRRSRSASCPRPPTATGSTRTTAMQRPTPTRRPSRPRHRRWWRGRWRRWTAAARRRQPSGTTPPAQITAAPVAGPFDTLAVALIHTT